MKENRGGGGAIDLEFEVHKNFLKNCVYSSTVSFFFFQFYIETKKKRARRQLSF